jgi:hypothetical protein
VSEQASKLASNIDTTLTSSEMKRCLVLGAPLIQFATGLGVVCLLQHLWWEWQQSTIRKARFGSDEIELSSIQERLYSTCYIDANKRVLVLTQCHASVADEKGYNMIRWDK